MNTRTVLALITATLATVTSYAGQERESFSSMQGMFLSFELGGLVGFDSGGKSLELMKHCETGGTLFNHTRKRPYRCKATAPADAELSGFVRVEMLEVAPKDEGEVPHVFTINNGRSTSWEIRSLSAQETAAIVALLQSDPIRYGSFPKRLRFEEAIAVKRPNSVFTTYFVPGEQIRDDLAFYAAERQHVFIGKQAAYSYQGRLIAKPTQYLDLNGDDFPEVVVEESCDGLCVSIWSIHSGPKRLGDLGGH